MADIDQLKQGAEILQQVDVTEIITSLALGIAQAQEKLDNNSIKQALALADPNNGIGGKSLIELGFAPTFYHFQYADVSADISLKMRLQTEFELDASLSFNYTQQGGYSAEKLDFLREDSSSKHRSEFKSSRSFVTHANNYESLTIDNTEVTMSETEGVINRLETFQEDIRSINTIDRVSTQIDSSQYVASEITSGAGVLVQNAGGYIVITLPQTLTDDEGILKVSNYTTTTNVEFDPGHSGDELTIGTTQDQFSEIMADGATMLGGGTLIGFKASDNKSYVGTTGTEMEVFFDFDKDNALKAFEKTENTAALVVLKKLAKVLEKDPLCKIKLFGYTDGSGGVNYNKDLSNRRASSLKAWFLKNGAKDNQVTFEGKGESLAGSDQDPNPIFRKVVVTFVSTADYFYFSGGDFDAATASPTTPGDNYFIYTDASGLTYPGPYIIAFKSGGVSILTNSATYADYSAILNVTAVTENFSSQIVDNSLYLLHNESSVKYTTYTNQEETTSYAVGSNETEDFSDTESRYLVDENINTSTRIKKDSETRKNPSTIAVGASVDVRVARQFEMSVSGNSRVAARLVSLPAPPEFLDELKNYYNA